MTVTMPKPADRPLRVFLFGTRGYMSVVLQRLLPDPRVTVVGLCSAKPAGLLQRSRARGGALQRRLHLRGRADFLVRDPFTQCADPWVLAERNGIACHAYQDVKRPEFLCAVQAARPDILLSAGFPRLIPTTVIQTPALVGVNLHPSLLPRHRGGTPNRWIVRKGERETGITAHVLDADFDTGDILGQWPIALDAGMSWGDVEVVRARLQLSRPLSEVPGGHMHDTDIQPSKAGKSLELCIKQDIHVGIGNYLWPSSVVLSRCVAFIPA